MAGQCYSNEDVASERTVRGVKRTYSLSSVQDQGNRFVVLRSVSRLGHAWRRLSIKWDAVHVMVGTYASAGYEFFAFACTRVWIMVGVTVGSVHN